MWYLKEICLWLFNIFRRLFYRKTVIKEIAGIKYELDLSENIDSNLYFRGYWEKNTHQLLEDILEPNFLVFEVGSNIGAHTFRIAKKLTHGMVYAFEPTQYAFTKLSRNYSLNNFDNIDLNNIALSNQEKSQKIKRYIDSSTLPFKASWDLKGKIINELVPPEENIIFKTLDNFVLKRKIKKIDLIKIDTDGYELKVIEGGLKTLTDFSPMIIIELGRTLNRIGDNVEDLINILIGLEYKFFSIPNKREFLSKNEIIKELDKFRTFDCLCLKNN